MTDKFTHLDPNERPTMVDVGNKQTTRREAIAEALIVFPPKVERALLETGHRTHKGPVFDTANIAGVMGAKRTHELIPFCHPLAIDDCSIDVEAHSGGVRVRCRVATTGRTGVEMEALTGASVAALTIYDMCKALSHDIEIVSVRLMAKSGGKSEYVRP